MQLFNPFCNLDQIKIDKPIRLIELFAGVGSQAMALRDIGANFEHYRVCEFDRFAIQSYNAIHGTSFPVSDIRDWKGDDLGIVDKDLTFATKRNCAVQMQDGSIRPLTADEYELLQTLPQGYTDCLSESGRKTVCALGWTVDVLAYIFQHMEESEHHIKSNYRRKLF